MVNIAVMKVTSIKEMEAESPGHNGKHGIVENIIHNKTSSSVKKTTSNLNFKPEQVKSEMNGEKEVKSKEGKSSEDNKPSVMNTRNKVKHENIKEQLSVANKEESPKQKKKNEIVYEPPKLEGNVDIFCWRCHKDGNVISCRTCPRVFHRRCARLEIKPSDWVCPDCDAILKADNLESRSGSMKSLTVEQLSKLLRFVIQRMRYHDGSSHFDLPVDPVEYPHYKDFVIKPMYLTLLENNIKKNIYGSTEAFLADAKWLVHNSVIFNSVHSDLTVFAKALVKIAKQETEEIENCSDCYQHAHVLNEDVWFIEPCNPPHILLWAKLKGFPFWPGKVMRSIGNMVDVRFFGDHNRAWVPTESCILYSKEIPASAKSRRLHNLDICVQEVEEHIKKLKAKYGRFSYFPFRTVYNPKKHSSVLAEMLPDYDQNTYTEKLANPAEESGKTEGVKSKNTVLVSSLSNQKSGQDNSHEAEAVVNAADRQRSDSVSESKDDNIEQSRVKKRGFDDKEISGSNVKKLKKEEKKLMESKLPTTLIENSGNPIELLKLIQNNQVVTLLKKPRVILHKLKDELISDFVKMKNHSSSSYTENKSNENELAKKKVSKKIISKVFGVDITKNVDKSCSESDTDSSMGKAIGLGDYSLVNVPNPNVKKQALPLSLNVDNKCSSLAIDGNGFRIEEEPKPYLSNVENSIVKECVELKKNTSDKIDDLTDNLENYAKKETDQKESENIKKLKTGIYTCKESLKLEGEVTNTHKERQCSKKVVINIENSMGTNFRDESISVNDKAMLDNNRSASSLMNDMISHLLKNSCETVSKIANDDQLAISNDPKNKNDSVIQTTECLNVNASINKILNQSSSTHSHKIEKTTLVENVETEVSSSHLLTPAVKTDTSGYNSHSKNLNKASLKKSGLIKNKKRPTFSKLISLKKKQKVIINSREFSREDNKLSKQNHKLNQEKLQLFSEGNEKESELTIDDIISAVKEAKTKKEIIKVIEERLTHLDFLHRSKLREMQYMSERKIEETKVHLGLDLKKEFDKLKERLEEEAYHQVEKLKRKQWCMLCLNEAKFHCCFGTNYCDTSCQEADWPTHMQVCTQYKMRAGDPAVRLSPSFRKLFSSHLERSQNSEDVYDAATIQDLISNTDSFPKMQIASHASSYIGKYILPEGEIGFRPKLQTNPTQLTGVFKIPMSSPRMCENNMKQEVKVLRSENVGINPNCIILYNNAQNSSLHDIEAGSLKQNVSEEDSNNNNSGSINFISNSDSVYELRASKLSSTTHNVTNYANGIDKSSGIVQNVDVTSNSIPVIYSRESSPKESTVDNIVLGMNKCLSETSSREFSFSTIKRGSSYETKQCNPVGCAIPNHIQTITSINSEIISKSSAFMSVSDCDNATAKSGLSHFCGMGNTMVTASCTKNEHEISHLLGSSTNKNQPIIRHFELPQIIPTVSNKIVQSIQDCNKNRIHCIVSNNKNKINQNLSNVMDNVKVLGSNSPKLQEVIYPIINVSGQIKKTDSGKPSSLKSNHVNHKVRRNLSFQKRVSARLSPVLATPACVNGLNFNNKLSSESPILASLPSDRITPSISIDNGLKQDPYLVTNDIHASHTSPKNIIAQEPANWKSKEILKKLYQPTDSSDCCIVPFSSSCAPLREESENGMKKSSKTSFTFCESKEEPSLKFTSAAKSPKTLTFSTPNSVMVSNVEKIIPNHVIEVNDQSS